MFKIPLLLTLLLTLPAIAAPTSAPTAEPLKLKALIPAPVVLNAVIEVFPEAYREFMTISVEWKPGGSLLVPREVTFLMPARHFESLYSPSAIDVRLDALVQDLGARVPDLSACPKAKVGPPEDFAWHSWADKRVRKVTVEFHVGC